LTLFIAVQFIEDVRFRFVKKLIIKSLFQNKTFFLQSSKVRTFCEMDKKSWFSIKNYAKKFHFNLFCPYFCPVKTMVFSRNYV